MSKYTQVSALEGSLATPLQTAIGHLNDLIKKSSSGLALELLHHKYCIFYEKYLMSVLSSFLHEKQIHDSSNLQTEFKEILSFPEVTNAYCNEIVDIVMSGLQELSKFIASDAADAADGSASADSSDPSTIQTLYKFIQSNSDKLLTIKTIAYIINRADGTTSAYTSSDFMKSHDISVVKHLSESKETETSAYLHNSHWYLTFREEGIICVIDPNSEKESTFVRNHPKEDIKYLSLNIYQGASTLSGTCGKVCIALKTVFPELFSFPSIDAIVRSIMSLDVQEKMSELDSKVLELLKEDNSYYFETLELAKTQPSYDVAEAIQQIISIECKGYGNFRVSSKFSKFLQGNIECNALEIGVSPVKIIGDITARKISVEEKLATGEPGIIDSVNGPLLVDNISKLLLEMLVGSELNKVKLPELVDGIVGLSEFIGSTSLAKGVCFVEIIGDMELGEVVVDTFHGDLS